MNIKEAADLLDGIVPVNDPKLIFTMKPYMDALKMARKGLECWGAIKNTFDCIGTVGEVIKVKEVKAIIDSYIEEIENDQ